MGVGYYDIKLRALQETEDFGKKKYSRYLDMVMRGIDYLYNEYDDFDDSFNSFIPPRRRRIGGSRGSKRTRGSKKNQGI